MSHQFHIEPVTHFDAATEGGTIRISTGDRILWRDPFGIGGVAIAATIGQIMVYGEGAPCALALNVEPSEPVRAVAGWAKETGHYGEWPSAMFGNGCRVVVSGDTFLRDLWRGHVRLAAKDDADKAKDDTKLHMMPEWWESRRDMQREEDA